MSYSKQTKPVIPTPATATEALHTATVTAYSRHFASILTPELMIAHRKGAYATIINGTQAGVTLEAILGTVNAKIATEQILANISAGFSEVPAT